MAERSPISFVMISARFSNDFPMVPRWIPLQVMTIRGALELAESQRLAAETARVARIHNIVPRTPGSQKQASGAEKLCNSWSKFGKFQKCRKSKWNPSPFLN